MYDRHVFICQNHKGEGKASCAARGSVEILEEMKSRSKKHPALATQRLRINKSGCLGQCEHGPTIVVYPEGVWYAGVKLEDVDELIEQHLVKGQPVERLRLKGEP